MGFFKRLANLFTGRDDGSTQGPHFDAPQAAIDYFHRDFAWKPVASSNVAAIGFFTSVRRGERSCLGVKFLGGAFYLYDVPLAYYTEALVVSSKGKWVWARLRRAKVPYAGPY